MTLQTRAWVTAASLVVLAVAGEFVGAARRRILRREVPGDAPPTLLPGQILLRLKGPDGRPIPQSAVAEISWPVRTGPRGGVRRPYGMSSGYAVAGTREEEDTVRWLEISGPADMADEPLPFGAVLTGPVPRGTSLLEVVLPSGRTIAGTIRRGGKPLSDVKIRARIAYPAEFECLSTGDSWHSRGRTGEDGRFLLDGLGEGVQEVGFESPAGLAIADRRIESGGSLDLDLDAERTVTVEVLEADGRPVGNAPVAARDPAPRPSGVTRCRAQGITDGNGRIRFVGLDPAERLRLVIHRPGTGAVNPGEEQDWTPSDVSVRLRKQRGIRVKVLDEKGAPHPGVAVVARPAEEGRPGGSGITGQDGTCTISGLDAGPLTVTLKDACSFRPEGAPWTRTVGAEEKEATVTLPRGASVTLRLDGYAAPGLVLLLREEGGDAASTGSFQGQFVTWHGLKPGATYGAFVAVPAWNWAARVDGILPTGGKTPVQPAPALILQATVRWPEGARDREVHAAWGECAAGKGEEQANGSWLIRCLPPGKYVVVATCTVPGREAKARASVEAAAGGATTLEVR